MKKVLATGAKNRFVDGLGSIRSRLTGIGLFFILGTSLALAVVGVRLTSGFVQSRAGDNFKLLASYLARNAELGIMLENPKMLEPLARNVLALDDIQEVVFLGGQGQVLLRQQKETSPAGGLGRVAAPVIAERLAGETILEGEYNLQEIGQVTLVYSRDGFDLLGRQVAGRFLLMAFMLAAGAVLLYWFMARSIVAPLKNLLAVARDVSRGRQDVRADGGALPETRALAATFNEMLDALGEQRRKLAEAHSRMARQQALAELGKFSMMVAHEIKNPLAIIKGSLDLLKKEELDAETRNTVTGYLDEEVVRINRLIEDFLLFARPGQPVLQPVMVADFLSSLSNRMDLARRDGGAAVELAPVAPELRLFCDPGLLERAIINIIRNADEAGARRIRIEAGGEGERLLLRISDDGPGIGEEVAGRIFEPFFSTKAKGSGLGLAMVREIIEAHGGRVEVESPAAGGTVFGLELPLDAVSEDCEEGVDGTHPDR